MIFGTKNVFMCELNVAALTKDSLITLSHMVINGKETERFVHFTEAVDWVVNKKQCSRQEATWFVHDNMFTMGTDRAIWLTI